MKAKRGEIYFSFQKKQNLNIVCFGEDRDNFAVITNEASLNLEMLSVYPPVTPVCFASMYSGLSPDKHGIQSYTKPVMKCSTVFDILSSEGKKGAIVSTANDSISMIFQNRNIDYFIYKTKMSAILRP